MGTDATDKSHFIRAHPSNPLHPWSTRFVGRETNGTLPLLRTQWFADCRSGKARSIAFSEFLCVPSANLSVNSSIPAFGSLLIRRANSSWTSYGFADPPIGPPFGCLPAKGYKSCTHLFVRE